jgi:hypothetical protein
VLEKRIDKVPFLDEFDLRYRNRVTRPKPCTQAVMFCLMDVSGSMDEQRKDIAKRFFMLLYHFLHNTYEHIQVVFIRHHTSAQEVDEQEFFQSRDTGGTLVSTALDLMDRIIAARYPREDWNIYAAQASDGDNWPMDSARCRDLLVEREGAAGGAVLRLRANRRRPGTAAVGGVRQRARRAPAFRHAEDCRTQRHLPGVPAADAQDAVMSRLISEDSDWSFEIVERFEHELGRLAESTGSTPIPTSSKSSVPNR